MAVKGFRWTCLGVIFLLTSFLPSKEQPDETHTYLVIGSVMNVPYQQAPLHHLSDALHSGKTFQSLMEFFHFLQGIFTLFVSMVKLHRSLVRVYRCLICDINLIQIICPSVEYKSPMISLLIGFLELKLKIQRIEF